MGDDAENNDANAAGEAPPAEEAPADAGEQK